MMTRLFCRDAARCRRMGLVVALGLAACGASAQKTALEPAEAVETPKPGLWEHGIGEGFRSGTQSFSVLAGGAYGVEVFGSRQRHDLALLSLSYGRMLGGVKGQGHWWRGNWELRGELFGGAQVSPETEWLVGLTPHLRYNFATDHPWVPFFDAGAGVSGTGIGHPDLSSTFEFNLQAGGGVHWFVRDNLAVTLEGHFLHLSNAGTRSPNQGVNSLLGTVGLTRFF